MQGRHSSVLVKVCRHLILDETVTTCLALSMAMLGESYKWNNDASVRTAICIYDNERCDSYPSRGEIEYGKASQGSM